MIQTSLKAFTLVELIVVVTIIAILGTVGFVSYSNYLTTARDSNRISQLTRISDALQVYSTRSLLPLPDNAINITDGTNTIAFQGNLGETVLQTIDYSTTARDPRDNTPFTYFLSADRNNFQLLAFMEDQNSLQANNFNNGALLTGKERRFRGEFISQSYANIYLNRFPKTYGQRLGVLTDTENTPLQQLTIPSNTLDISTTTLTLKSFLSDTEFVVDNLTTLPELQSLVPQRGRFWAVVNNAFVYTGEEEPVTGGGGTPPPSSNRYPGCNTDDITVGSYTIAACNVGSTTAGTTSSSYGRLFQWGENIAWTASSGVTSANNCTWDRDTQSCTTPNLSAWPTSVSDTASGGSDRWFDYGDTRGPCAVGYRVPTQVEWSGIRTAGGWASSNGSGMQTALQIPYAGNRNNSTGTWNSAVDNGYYWSTSPSSANAHSFYIRSDFISTDSASSRLFGFSVRCIRN